MDFLNVYCPKRTWLFSQDEVISKYGNFLSNITAPYEPYVSLSNMQHTYVWTSLKRKEVIWAVALILACEKNAIFNVPIKADANTCMVLHLHYNIYMYKVIREYEKYMTKKVSLLNSIIIHIPPITWCLGYLHIYVLLHCKINLP